MKFLFIFTCLGPRCTDPGTPGGMTQTEANFEVGGSVVYSCFQSGYRPSPRTRTCFYDTTAGIAMWDGSEPVCEGKHATIRSIVLLLMNS